MFDYLQPIADTALIRFDPPLVVGIRNSARKKHSDRCGTYVRQVLPILFGWGAEDRHMTSNPARLVKNAKRSMDAVRANRPWSDEGRAIVLERASPIIKGPLALMVYTAIGPKDTFPAPARDPRQYAGS